MCAVFAGLPGTFVWDFNLFCLLLVCAPCAILAAASRTKTCVDRLPQQVASRVYATSVWVACARRVWGPQP